MPCFDAWLPILCIWLAVMLPERAHAAIFLLSEEPCLSLSLSLQNAGLSARIDVYLPACRCTPLFILDCSEQ